MKRRTTSHRLYRRQFTCRLGRWTARLFAVLFWLALPASGFAQLVPDAGSISYLADPGGQLTLSGAVARRNDWKSAPGSRASGGFSNDPIWFSWQLPDPSNAAGLRMLELDAGSARGIQAWLINARGQVLRKFEMGASQRYGQRRNKHSEFVIPVLSKRKLTVIARVESVEPIQFSPVLWPADAYRDVAKLKHTGHAVVTGIGIAMMLFGLMMFVSLREKAYLAFVFWIPVLLLLQSFESGLAFRWLWPDKPAWNNYGAVVIPAVFAAGTGLLTMTALDIRSNPPIWLRVIFQVSGAAALFLVATISLIPWSLAIQMAWGVTAIILIASIVASVIRLTQRAKAAGGYLVGMLGICVAVPGHWMIELGWAGPVSSDNKLLLIAGSFSVVAISVGLAQRLYSEDRLRQHAQSNLMKSHKAATGRLEENVRARTFELEIANERLARVNRIDGLTGVFNRRHFDESLKSAMLHASSRKQPLAVMMIDLDFFKRLNDDYGHAAGDACLIEASKRAEACVPETDGIVARYGGEEFVGLLTSTTMQQAEKVAESMRSAIEAARIEYDGQIITMTASLGLHCDVPDSKTDPAAFLACADDALYRAKENGRNQVVTSGHQAETTKLTEASVEPSDQSATQAK